MLRSFEPAFAGGIRPGSFALAMAYRVAAVRWGALLVSVGSKQRVQHHEHSRVISLYHKAINEGSDHGSVSEARRYFMLTSICLHLLFVGRTLCMITLLF